MTTMRGRAPLLLALLALLRHFFSVESVVGKGDDADDDYGATVEVDFDELLSGEFNTTQPEAFDPALIQPRIFGGRAVSSEVETYPYVVLLSQGGEIDCAGCLIGPRVVLTAGHCRGTDTVYVQDPEGSSTDGRPSFRRYNVRKEVRHPDYDSSELDYDASLLLLWTSPGVDTAAIDTGDVAADLQSGQELMIMGWGATSENGGRPKAMHVVSLPYVSQLVCKSRYGEFITDRMMCFGGGGRDACQGDSGGPLVQRAERGESQRDIQVGIISWGVGCAKTGFPGVYVRVHEVSSWIQEVCSSWGEPISSPRRDRPPQRHSTTKPTPVTLPTIPPTPTSMAASGTVKPEPRTPQPTQGAHASPPFMAPPPLRAMPPSSPLFVARPTVSPTASPAVPATVYDPLCPPDKWYIVRWKLRIPYDAKLWAATLGSAARLSLSRWLRGVEVNPGLIRIYSLDVSDDDLDVWGRGSSATCQGPTMTAEHWIHFLSRDVARSFQSWLQSADEYLLPFIYKSVPELCGARTSTDPSIQVEGYCLITERTGEILYLQQTQDSGVSAQESSS